MKKLSILITLLVLSFMTKAQGQIEIGAYSGYTFQSKFNIYGGNGKVRDGYTGGINLGYYIRDNFEVEFLYQRQKTQVRAESFYLNEVYNENVTFNYILVGGNRVFPSIDDAFQYYGGLKIGMCIIDFTEDQYNQIVKFAANANAGIKYYLSDVLGVNAGLGLSFPITDAGASLGWSSGSGTSVGMSGYSPIAQFNINAGISVRLGK